MSSNLRRKCDKKAKCVSTCFDDLPVELQILILEKVSKISAKYPQALFNLSSTCKFFRDILNEPNSQKLWEEAWHSVKQHRPAAQREENKLENGLEYSAKQKLRLAGFTGCMICKIKGIRKVAWEFGVRCCKECLIHNTIAEFYLNRDYDLPSSALSQLPYMLSAPGFSKYLGSTRWKTYWKSFLTPVLQTNLGVSSLQEYDALKAERLRIAREQWIAQEREREDKIRIAAEEEAMKEKERKTQLDAWLIEDNLDISIATHSQTYKRNSCIAAPLQRSDYEKLLLQIMSEICEAASLLTDPKECITNLITAQELLVKDMTAKQEANKIAVRMAEERRQQKDLETRLARTASKEINLTCSVCGGGRLFMWVGLRDHTRAKHPHRVPEALKPLNVICL